MANTTMMFPNTVREFMEQYKMVDTEHIYSNGIEYVPIFRMEQWFAHQADVPRWIPVTDRLPGREGMYLVTSLDGGLHVETTKWFFTTFDGGFFLCDLERNSVVAWMPLPEPYKEGEQNG